MSLCEAHRQKYSEFVHLDKTPETQRRWELLLAFVAGIKQDERFEGIRRLSVFGSVARNEAREGDDPSDVDVLWSSYLGRIPSDVLNYLRNNMKVLAIEVGFRVQHTPGDFYMVPVPDDPSYGQRVRLELMYMDYRQFDINTRITDPYELNLLRNIFREEIVLLDR